MEILKEAKNVVDFATYYPLLNKATIDNDSPIPGYLFEEIIKLSCQSPGHRQLLLDFLLARLHSASWAGKQKVVRVLSQLCARGHRGMRVLLRGRDGDLRKAASVGGPPDPLLANTPQLFLSSAIQELLTRLFDPKIMKEDEAWLAGQIDDDAASPNLVGGQGGYGGGPVGGRYQGFGSTPNTQPDSLVTQVRGLVERVISPQADGQKLETDLLGGSDKGDYKPLSLPSLGSSFLLPTSPTSRPQIAVLSASYCNKYKAHRKGKAGGGWESDDEDDLPLSPPITLPPLASLPDLGNGATGNEGRLEEAGGPEEEFLSSRIDPVLSWPVNHDVLVNLCQECSTFNLDKLLRKIKTRMSRLLGVKEENGDTTSRDNMDKLERDLQMTTSLVEEMNIKSSISTSADINTTISPPFADTTHKSVAISQPPISTPSDTIAINATSLSGRDLASSLPSPVITSFLNTPSSFSLSSRPPTNSPSPTSIRLLLLLLLVEFGMHYEVFPPTLVHSILGEVLANTNKNGVESVVKIKAKKLLLILTRLRVL